MGLIKYSNPNMEQFRLLGSKLGQIMVVIIMFLNYKIYLHWYWANDPNMGQFKLLGPDLESHMVVIIIFLTYQIDLHWYWADPGGCFSVQKCTLELEYIGLEAGVI